jgi:hypothetical protein
MKSWLFAPTVSRAARTISSSSLALPRRPKGSPPDLERPETLRDEGLQNGLHLIGLLHEKRTIWPDLRAVDAAEEPADGLAQCLAQNVPERDVDAADRVGQRPAASHPEAVLVELLGHSLGLQGVLSLIERLEHLQCRPHQSAISEDAAISGDAFFGMHRDQGMHGIVGPDLGGPAALGAVSHERCCNDGADAQFIECHCMSSDTSR